MAIPWLIGAAVVAGVGALLASDDDSSSRSSGSSSSSADLERERERARSENKRKKEEAEKQAIAQRKASENKSKAQRFITKYKLSVTPAELVSANKQGNQLSLRVMNDYNTKESVCQRDRDIRKLEQELANLERFEEKLIGKI